METEQKLSLPALVSEYSQIAQMLTDAGGELSPEMEERLNNLDVQTAGKIDAYHFFIEKLKHDIEFWSDEAARYQKIAKGCDTLIERLRNGIIYAMSSLGQAEIEGHAIRAKLSPTKGRLVINEKEVPDEYKMQEVKMIADRERIREALDRFEEIPGAKIEGGMSLRFYSVKPDRKKVGGKSE